MNHLVVLLLMMLDEPEYGGWCDSCALPSLVTVRFVLVDKETLRIVDRQTFVRCLEENHADG